MISKAKIVAHTTAKVNLGTGFIISATKAPDAATNIIYQNAINDSSTYNLLLFMPQI